MKNRACCDASMAFGTRLPCPMKTCLKTGPLPDLVCEGVAAIFKMADVNCQCPTHRDIRTRVLTYQRDRNYVYAVVSFAADSHFVGGPIVMYIFSRVSVGSACVRVWKTDCDVTSLVEHRVKSLQKMAHGGDV